MDRSASRGFMITFQVFSAFFFLVLLLGAVGGIVLKTSTSALSSTVKAAMSGYDGNADDALQFASFLLEIVDATAIYTIVVGAVLALFSLTGLIASFCAGSTMLKVYASIVTVLLTVQIIVIAVLFAKPTEFTVSLTNTTQNLLELYGSEGEEGARATAIWRVLMETKPRCCGMDGYEDFEKLNKTLPVSCCKASAKTCNNKQAKKDKVEGCRSKVEKIASLRSTILLYSSIGMIVMQAVVVVLVILLICTNNKEEVTKDQGDS